MRRFLPWFILLFPALELWVLIQVGKEVGALATVGLVILSTCVGLWLLRLRGMHIAKNMQAELAAGHIPSTPIVDTFCLMAAGWLFVFPGFVSDILAILLIIPFVRKALFAVFVSRLKSRGFQAQTVHFASQNGGGASWTCTTFGSGSGNGPSRHEPHGNAVIIDCEPKPLAQGDKPEQQAAPPKPGTEGAGSPGKPDNT